MLRKVRNNLVKVISSRHIAGSELGDALKVCRWAHSVGYRSILSPWSAPEDNQRSMFDRYSAAIDVLDIGSSDCYLSIKLDAIGYDAGLFDDLMEHARSRQVRVHVDSLGPETAKAHRG